ncbi:GON-4-like protein [Eumeta japonica]|uniref:GON-4-like protein n=1 Tax=Eumeta variegata TaxID=151549 RepID=A0A4C1Y228_EUMVA|nr:GON-4-like protein [Eumeta japonica]
MLPSMPVLFSRESQDAFGNKILSNAIRIDNNTATAIAKRDSSVRTKANVKIKNNTRSKVQIGLTASSNEDPKEIALVTSYFSKVKARFAANRNQPNNKFVQFQNLLKTFDPKNETPVNLYRKIEVLFGEEHRDLIEDFLLFLTPSQAQEIGRFMDHFEMNKLVNFIDILKSTFAHRPTILRKVIRAMTSSLNCGNIEEMKSRVLPHFRSHPRLTHLFKSLFPDERPPESWYDTADTINESILTDDCGYDIWEFEEPKKGKEDKFVKGELDTVVDVV